MIKKSLLSKRTVPVFIYDDTETDLYHDFGRNRVRYDFVKILLIYLKASSNYIKQDNIIVDVPYRLEGHQPNGEFFYDRMMELYSKCKDSVSDDPYQFILRCDKDGLIPDIYVKIILREQESQYYTAIDTIRFHVFEKLTDSISLGITYFGMMYSTMIKLKPNDFTDGFMENTAVLTEEQIVNSDEAFLRKAKGYMLKGKGLSKKDILRLSILKGI